MVKDEGETGCKGRKRVRKEEEISKGGEKMESMYTRKKDENEGDGNREVGDHPFRQ